MHRRNRCVRHSSLRVLSHHIREKKTHIPITKIPKEEGGEKRREKEIAYNEPTFIWNKILMNAKNLFEVKMGKSIIKKWEEWVL